MAPAVYVSDLIKYIEATFKALDCYLVRPSSSMMGNIRTPKLLVLDYCSEVAAWNTESTQDERMIMVRDPVTCAPADLCVGVFVDDAQKLRVSGPTETHDQLVHHSVVVGEPLEGRC